MIRHLLQLVLLLTLITSLAPLGYSQSANANVSNIQSSEVIGENDRLTFMETDHTVESREPSSSGLLLKSLGALLLIVGMLFFVAWGARKLGFGGTSSGKSVDEIELTVLSTISMGSGRTISTLRFGERVLLIGSTAESFTLLAEETKDEKHFLRNSRSVSDLLAEENGTFDDALQNAEFKLGRWEQNG